MTNSIVYTAIITPRETLYFVFCPSNHRIVPTFRPLADTLGVDWDKNVMSLRQFSGNEPDLVVSQQLQQTTSGPFF